MRDSSQWQGTPYVPKASVKGVGADCGGFVHAIYSPYYDLPPMPTNYAADWATHRDDELYLDFIMPFVNEVPRVLPGGFTLFHLGKAYSHAAIMLEDGNYIHAWGRLREGRVTITEPRVMKYLSKKFCSGFQPKHYDPK
jgi:cell wall-associated NlpC family hydrolase